MRASPFEGSGDEVEQAAQGGYRISQAQQQTRQRGPDGRDGIAQIGNEVSALLFR